MKNRYSAMLSPLQVGNVLMKNRLLSSAATPHFIQGTETFPTEKWITLMANRAKNGFMGRGCSRWLMWITAAPFFARLVETSLNEVDAGIVEAAKAMGSTNAQIIWKVLLPEALPSLIQAITTTLINLIGYTAMAGSLGGGGLGAVAQRYGYYRRQEDLLWGAVIVIIVIVQLIQLVGTSAARSINKK